MELEGRITIILRVAWFRCNEYCRDAPCALGALKHDIANEKNTMHHAWARKLFRNILYTGSLYVTDFNLKFYWNLMANISL